MRIGDEASIRITLVAEKPVAESDEARFVMDGHAPPFARRILHRQVRPSRQIGMVCRASAKVAVSESAATFGTPEFATLEYSSSDRGSAAARASKDSTT